MDFSICFQKLLFSTGRMCVCALFFFYLGSIHRAGCVCVCSVVIMVEQHYDRISALARCVVSLTLSLSLGSHAFVTCIKVSEPVYDTYDRTCTRTYQLSLVWKIVVTRVLSPFLRLRCSRFIRCNLLIFFPFARRIKLLHWNNSSRSNNIILSDAFIGIGTL